MSRETEADPILDRFLGTVLGSAVGDAMGGPLEFQPPSPRDEPVTEMIGGGWQQLDPGEWTDDTQMTICVIESLLGKRVFDPDDIASRLVAWMKSQPKDIGLHTSKILQAIADGDSWESASHDAYVDNPSDAPNGSLMRCAPLSLFFFRHSEFLTELSPVLSRITHAHPDCEWACVFLNVLITGLLGGGRVINAIELAYDSIDGASNELKERIGSAMNSECSAEPTGYVLDTLEVALWVFLHTESFEQAIITAVNKGGDADTIGAVTGALAGAKYGALAIPTKWLNTLHQVDRLCKYADGLYELAME
jgi:ADP-ribosyl-[dinitrogen reductase] hydrolase